MRLFFLFACFSALLAAQDAREIVRRSLETERKNDEIARQYTYLERQETRNLDSSGALKSRTVVTYDVTVLEGSPYRRLVGRNDKPISPDEQQREEAKLLKSLAQRREETAAAKKERVDAAEKRRMRSREQLQEIADAFDFARAGEERTDGADVWVIDATPHPGFRPKTDSGRILVKVKARLWIEKQDYRWVRADVETLDTISFGGILLRLAKGGRIRLEQTRVNDEVWLPKHVTVTASARIFLIKGVRIDLDYLFSDYKKFRVESRVVEGSGVQ